MSARGLRTAGAAALALVTQVACMSPTASLPADKPDMKIGDQWNYRVSGGPDAPSQWSEQVVDVMSQGRYRVRVIRHTRPEQIVEVDGPGNVVQVPPFQTLYTIQYPLTIGKQWTASVVDTPAQTRTIDYRVAAAEKLRVADKEFDCLRLEGRETTAIVGAGVESQGKIWYCPALRNIARRETSIPGAGVVRQELVWYHLAS